MPTKTQRILDLLPRTFRALPALSALKAVADAPGRELLAAENALAELMRAHWVDHADRGAEAILDLELFAALYGLAPRADESVEEFREHLKRFVRTFLEGTVTVPGILRIAAENLGLRIADGPGEIDGWWRGADPELIETERGPGEAAPAEPARIAGTADLAGGVALGAATILQLKVDGAVSVEIDLAGTADADGLSGLDDVAASINAAVAEPVASHDDRFLTLTSPTAGAAGSLELLELADEIDAAPRLFGFTPRHASGEAAGPARLRGPELADPLDLTAERYLRLAVDGTLPAEIDCAGADPGATTLGEVRARINAALGAEVASLDGAALALTSPSEGAASSLVFQTPAAQDARRRLFGDLAATAIFGAAARPARLEGRPDLSGGVDLAERSRVRLRLDNAAAVVVDLAGAEPSRTTLAEIVAAIDDAVGAAVASHDGRAVTVTSTKSGPTSRVAFLKLDGDASDLVFGVSPRIYHGKDAGDDLLPGPLVVTRRRRFVSRAAVTDASKALFGFVEGKAEGRPAAAARVVGTPDLSRGVDLSEARWLRLALDGGEAADVEVAGLRPRTTALGELVERLAGAFGEGVASHDGRHLVLTSPSRGATSAIAFEPPRATDALDEVLGAAPGTVRGTAATRVAFTGTVDLAAGADLEAGAAVRLGVDGADPVEIVLTEAAAHLGLGELVTVINLALGGAVAAHDGVRLRLVSPSQGASSRLEFAVPAGGDATPALFGIAGPRVYQGREATPAVVTGHPVAGPLDMSTARFLRLAVDGSALFEVDLASAAESAAAVTLGEAAASLDETVATPIATVDGGRLVLTSPTTGLSSRLTLEHSTAGDARALLFGDVDDGVSGADPSPAVLTGEVDLLAPVDLADRRLLRLAVDGGDPIDVEVAGAAPETTLLAEVVAALNAAVPGIAAATDDDRLELTSPSAGDASRLAVLPRRYLEVVEYPPEAAAVERAVRHGGAWTVHNTGAAGVHATIEVLAPRGAFGAAVVHRDLAVKVRLREALPPGDLWRLALDPATGLVATIEDSQGTVRDLDPSRLAVDFLGSDAPSWPANVLALPRGRVGWLYLECLAARFDEARFDEARFAGEPCFEPGVFDASRFATEEDGGAVFADEDDLPPEVEVAVRWTSHRPGAFEVNLPAELPSRFGGRFGEARFGSDAGEVYEAVALEPPVDENHLIERLKSSMLVRGEEVAVVPLGFEAAEVPFRKPRPLTLGGPDQPAELYLAVPGGDGFLKICVRPPEDEAAGEERPCAFGEWGNEIALAVRPAGPGLYDVIVSFAGARFENARAIVAGPAPPALAEELLRPGPIGVLQAKAAGVAARVTRDRAELPESDPQKP